MNANLTEDNAEQLRAWTCIKCGAPLPVEAKHGPLVTCVHCGTPFKSPAVALQGGGVSISAGAITVGGNVIGGDLIVTSDASRPVPPRVQPQQSRILLDAESVKVGGDVLGGSLVTDSVRPLAIGAKRQGLLERFLHLFRKN